MEHAKFQKHLSREAKKTKPSRFSTLSRKNASFILTFFLKNPVIQGCSQSRVWLLNEMALLSGMVAVVNRPAMAERLLEENII